MKKRFIYLLAALIIFITEIIIAAKATGFIRGSVGDVLVVVLMGTAVRSIYPHGIRFLPLYLFIFSVFIEILQLINILKLLSLDGFRLLVIVFGGTFSFGDILCYAIGAMLFGAFEHLLTCLSDKSP